MDALLLVVIPFLGYLIAYHLYGKFLAKKIFKLNDANPVPSQTHADGSDFIATAKTIVFGHHYTSIAGTGPIVGPAIGIIWGWLPAILWIFLGSIIMGAVHDFGCLVISLRHEGKSISDITAKYLSPRLRYVFFIIVFIALWIVIAIFGLVIAIIFAIFPQSVLAVWLQIPIAIGLGWLVYKKGSNLGLTTALAIALMYATIWGGEFLPIKLNQIAGIPATGLWSLILLAYAFVASTLPVTTLLQPRDYINAWQLFVAMGLLFLGILVSSIFGTLTIVAPAINPNPIDAPSLWPFLFITIACGAISGFHSLVSSGTSSKQLARESDALFVGYGSMLLEAALATLVVVAVAAGIGLAYEDANGQTLTGVRAWNAHYASWSSSVGLGSKIKAVVIGSANMMSSLGISKEFSVAIIGVFIASFAGTTLDSATRIQRYIISELFGHLKTKTLTSKYPATGLAVISAAILAFSSGANGQGALTLWPMFGAVNQLLAALALLVLSVYLKRERASNAYLLTTLPSLFMVSMTLWSVILNQLEFMSNSNLLLSVINSIILLLALWMVLEGYQILFQRQDQSQPKKSG